MLAAMLLELQKQHEHINDNTMICHLKELNDEKSHVERNEIF